MAARLIASLVLLTLLGLSGCGPAPRSSDAVATQVDQNPSPTNQPARTVSQEKDDRPTEAFTNESGRLTTANTRSANLETTPLASATADALQPVQPSLTPTAGAIAVARPAEPESEAIMVNGLSLTEFLLMPVKVRQHVAEIYRRGLDKDRNPRAFSQIGASIVDTVHFLNQFDKGEYDLGPYDYLQAAVDYFAGSFDRDSVGTRRGLHAWAVFNPAWADKERCRPNESVIDCEFRLQNPGLAFIILGTNDLEPERFEEKLGDIIQYCLDEGVIPILATKADRFEGEDDVNNAIIRRQADEFQVPLWDFDLLAATLPGRGISEDEVHLTFFFEYDYTLPKAFERGYGVYNLTALMVLEEIRQIMEWVDVADEVPIQ